MPFKTKLKTMSLLTRRISKMVLTNHAQKRSQQRVITKTDIDLILKYGKSNYKQGGAVEIGIKKKDKNKIVKNLKQLINKIDKIQDKRVLMIDGVIITVYHKT